MFHVLPTRSGGAAENMALDFLLLQRYPEAARPRFRHYGWQRPAVTFGYAQKIAFVRGQLSILAEEGGMALDICRRPTGGGIVDHRDDWTYAIVIPRGHPLEELRATESYRAVHEALAAALRDQGVAAVTKRTIADEPVDAANGVCFQRAEISDVVHEHTGAKIAGAAQKRNRHGLLFQGSLWRPAAGTDAVDWDRLHDDLVAGLAGVLGTAAVPVPWPEINEDEVAGLTEQYSAPEWIERR
jgi:lipoyl(octanoyl) transferase